MKDDIALIIPAYNPDNNLEKLIRDIKENSYNKIIVINDGSEKDEIFKKIEMSVIIIKHDTNKGKGMALKTGFKYCLENEKTIKGIITLDADGQHTIEDVNKIYEKFRSNNTNVILGSRDFSGKDIPLRSKIGNIMISKIVKRKTGIEIKDTQTGLRAIPIQYIKDFEEIEGAGFEYETNMILNCINKKIEIIELPIKTVYENNNKMSHFKSIKDSAKIYRAVTQNKGDN